MIDLVAELMAAQADVGLVVALQAARVPNEIIYSGMVGALNLALSEDETTWEPDPFSRVRAFITPCRIYEPNTPECLDHELAPIYGALVDLVAWHPDRPDRWALRTGNAGWLGACEPQMMGGAMRVRRNPLAWLKAGCDGVVALSPIWQERQRLFAIADTLIAEDFEHAQELRQLMERPTFVPRVKVA